MGKWEDWEIEILDKYKDNRQILQEKLPHRSQKSISSKIRNTYGKTQDGFARWEDWEIDLVKQLWENDRDELYEKLSHRSKRSVYWKSKEFREIKTVIRWEDWEVDILKEFYQKDIDVCYKKLPHKSRKSICDKANRLGLSTPVEPNWTDREDQILYDYFPDRDKISELTGRTLSAVKSRCNKLGVTQWSYWSEDEDNYLIKNYSSGDLDEISNYLNRPITSIRYRANVLGLHRDGYSDGRKYTFDEDLFSYHYLKSKDEATLLGNIYADGSVNEYTLRFNVAQIDRSYLEKIKTFTNHTGNIEDYGKRRGVGLRLNSTTLVKQLEYFGVHQNKTFSIKYPNQYILNGFEKEFIRGYFEGDGGVSYTKSGCKVSFAGTEDMMWNIRQYFIDNLNLSAVNIYKKKNGNTYSFAYSGRIQCGLIGEHLYGDILDGSSDCVIYMNRKIKVFQRIWDDLGW